MEFYAHYDQKTGWKQLLNSHLAAVAEYIKEQIPPNVTFGIIDNQILRKITFWLGKGHDLGKYTDYFQRYLLNGDLSELKDHALISSCMIYLLLLRNILLDLKDPTAKEVAAYLGYISVRFHHGRVRLESIAEIGYEEQEWDKLLKKKNNLFLKKEQIFSELEIASVMDFRQYLSLFELEELRQNKTFTNHTMVKINSGRINDDKWYFYLLYLFSLLIDSDKLDSAQINRTPVKNASPKQVLEYIKKKHGEAGSTLIDRREKARNTIMSVINNLSDNQIKETRFYLLTAPTGIGKTLSSLQCVLRLQERISEIEGYMPRIITAIPFINIIEQTRLEYEKVFGKKVDLLIHHGVSDFSTKKKDENDEIPIDKVLMEVESWEGDVILTTFVQLFQSIFTNKNRLLKKIHKLAGSIVVLDEAQAIPEKYMPLIGAVLQKIAEYYGTRFVLMTATQPKLLEFGNRLLKKSDGPLLIQLLPDYNNYFQQLKRTKFVPLLEKTITVEEFMSIFKEKWSGNSSALIVVNTIRRSIEVFNKIKSCEEFQREGVLIRYLSTNITPIQRRRVIAGVRRKLLNGAKVILVSTQTIEAGVDLDFDMAFRDFAPLDSLIQTAGRVNREGKKRDFSPVYIIKLESDSQYVYNLLNRKDTDSLIKKFMNDKGEIIEPEYCRLAEEYYEKLLSYGIADESKQIWNEGVIKLDFKEIQQFQMIEQMGEVYDVYVEDNKRYHGMPGKLANIYQKLLQGEGKLDKCECKLLGVNEKEALISEISIFQRKALLRAVTAKMKDYMIQVRVSRVKNNPPIEFKARGGVESSYYWIPSMQIEFYYDRDTGFKSTDVENAYFY